MYNLFLEAPSGTGKSTIIKKVIDNIDTLTGGFQVKRRLNKEDKIYFDMICVENKKGNNIIGISTKNKRPIPIINTFESKGVEILENSLKNNNLIILDEIGFLEEDAQKFKRSIRKVLDSNVVVLGVLKKFNSPFLNEIRERKDISILNVTLENRDYIVQDILNILKNWNISINIFEDELSL